VDSGGRVVERISIQQTDRGNPLIDALADWLISQALQDSPLEKIFEGTCKRLYAAGIPVARSYIAFRVLHPLYQAHALLWQRDRDVELQRYEHSRVQDDWRKSPQHHMLEHGGEVLRFIGDAVLAIFPISGEQDTATSCRLALQAASVAEKNLSMANAARASRGEESLDFGLGLHVGEALFGNIGVPERVEFSVIGPAANEVARLESLTKTLQRRILVSESFADNLSVDWVPAGEFTLRGVGNPVSVFTPPPMTGLPQ